jgi:deoxyribonuclease-4
MKDLGVKKSLDVPRVLSEMGLTAFEYQCGHGVAISVDSARIFGIECQKYGITPSVHAPYFISLSSESEETRIKSIEHIRKTAEVAKAMGAERIVVHSGSCGKMSREEALFLAKDTLARAVVALKEDGTDCVSICPETMGKINQLGTLDEVIEQCRVDKHYVPVVDFGHMNAREVGGYFVTSDDYRRIFDKIALGLGDEVARNLHCHFSKIEFTGAGEKKHLTFADTVYGPDFEPLIEAIVKEDLTPRIICESAGTQAEDAKAMKDYYERLMEAR